jgi:hypothetical protein
MSHSAAQIRLLELMKTMIGKLEGFISYNDQHPPWFAELKAVADYLGTLGLKPDGDWLCRQQDYIYSQRYALMESDLWAVNPEGARRWGYSTRFASETDEDRYHRHKLIRHGCERLLDHLRRIHQIASDAEQNEATSARTTSSALPRTDADREPTTPSDDPGLAPKLAPSREKAYLQFLAAVATDPNRLSGAPDSEVYSSVKEHLEAGERLPSFATWSRYLREAREVHSAQKNTPRSGRPTGKSVVREDQIDPFDCE